MMICSWEGIGNREWVIGGESVISSIEERDNALSPITNILLPIETLSSTPVFVGMIVIPVIL
jgi:hypothetical protein